MKKILLIICFLLLPASANAAGCLLTQGCIGTTTVPTNWVVLGDSALRVTAVATSSLGLESPLSFSSPLSRIGNIISFLFNTANTWTALNIFNGGASTTQLSVYNKAYFGATATSSFSSTGVLTLASALTVANGGTNQSAFSNHTLVSFDGTRLTSTSSPSFQSFNATSTTATSTISGNLYVVKNLQVDGMFFAPVSIVSSGNATINGTLTVTGQTTLATTLTGLLRGASGVISAITTSVGIAGEISDETGTGVMVFGTTPTFTTSALIPLGSVGAPGIAFTGDTNNGIWSSAADTLNLSTAGSERLRIDSAGNVGVGTTTPTKILSIAGTGYFGGATGTTTIEHNAEVLGALKVGTGSIYLNGSATSTFSAGIQSTALNITSTSATSTFANGIQLGAGCFRGPDGTCVTNADTSTFVTGAGSGANTRLAYWSSTSALTSSANLTFDGTTLTSREMLITSTSPFFTMNDSDTAGSDFRIDVADGAATFNADIAGTAGTAFLAFALDGVESGRFDTGGNFGIGTSSPYRKLSVSGDGVFTGGNVLASTFTATSTAGASTFPFASTTMITATTASTTNLTISGINSGSLLKTTTGGQVTAAVAGTDYAAASSVFGKAWEVSGNFLAPTTTTYVTNIQQASSTIFSANQAQFGGTATSTFTAAGFLGIGTTTPWGMLSVTNIGTGPSFVVEDSASPDTTPFLIDASGNVGIGDASPASLLTVGSGDLFQVTSTGAITAIASYSGTGANAVNAVAGGDILSGGPLSTFQYDHSIGTVFDQYSAGSVTGASFSGRKSRGTAGGETVITTGDDLVYLRGYGYDGSAFTESSRITFDSTGTIASGQIPGRILFHTASSAGTLTQRLLIDSAGLATFANGIDSTTGDFSSSLTMSGSAANIELGSNFLSGDGGDEGISVTTTGSVETSNSLSVGTTFDVTNGLSTMVRISAANVLSIENGTSNADGDGIYINAGANTNPSANTDYIFFRDGDGTTIGSIDGDAAGGVRYNLTSDKRVKDNIVNTQYGLEDLLKVRTVDYTGLGATTTRTGFIAQELNLIFPVAVSTNGDNGEVPLDNNAEPWQVDYSRMTPLLTQAIQDLNWKLESLATSTPQDVDSFAGRFFPLLFTRLTEWLASSTNGIEKFFAREVHAEKICLGETCVTETELKELLNLRGRYE